MRITCDKCLSFIEASAGSGINFCAFCGSHLKKIDATGEQPFHLPENIKKALDECADILQKMKAQNSTNRDQTREALDKLSRDAKRVKNLRITDVADKIEGEEFSKCLDDLKWFEKLKEL